MLTESEKQWIEHREAMQFLTGTYIADFEEYPLWNPGKDWQEAAEFEARVAVKLATAYANYVKNRICIDFDLGMRCPGFQTCARKRPHPPCDFAVLKGVMLQVEEEMDAEMDK